ncbi:MAG: hypothetical protein KA250_10615 [Verrucomicrobiales bacterium]|jgi:tetratricopeptide (TPR) repeat protein|nr:hypothetical protein [Verrucomicrobiales bacterium]MBP9222792.1 hypothetical protein [Verrucomicrobiales bacterium]HQZ29129.1 hypothetical protein [Verrucomicrobiales bacterium]
MTRISSSFCALFLVVPFATSALADVSSQTREYRPLIAKAVRIEISNKVDQAAATDASQLRRDGWSQFDRKHWEKAIDLFLSALEKEPSDQSAAEGLTMSLYQSGDYASVIRLGDQLTESMPDIKRIIARTLEADVLALVNQDQLDQARKLLAHFPGEDVSFLPARQVLGRAVALESEITKEETATTTVESIAGN